jgi:hypothetical protein
MDTPKPEIPRDDYVERRERLQRDLAARALHPRVASIHNELADRYADQSFEQVRTALGDNI